MLRPRVPSTHVIDVDALNESNTDFIVATHHDADTNASGVAATDVAEPTVTAPLTTTPYDETRPIIAPVKFTSDSDKLIVPYPRGPDANGKYKNDYDFDFDIYRRPFIRHIIPFDIGSEANSDPDFPYGFSSETGGHFGLPLKEPTSQHPPSSWKIPELSWPKPASENLTPAEIVRLGNPTHPTMFYGRINIDAEFMYTSENKFWNPMMTWRLDAAQGREPKRDAVKRESPDFSPERNGLSKRWRNISRRRFITTSKGATMVKGAWILLKMKVKAGVDKLVHMGRSRDEDEDEDEIGADDRVRLVSKLS
ncbi:hypothetical protein P280DRAFT_468366 [Massarina eburnea CBS 473.64]|uniref:Uncharacterized protein n=1 Tax=Massarina eburnea CBS 473.64 TaxID=1395130 RepID=A0A6A6S414_9PLEO|nr:hypothetical protein P280DRAFT_468366 [Massarina eburnea CBS 473.64]